MGQEGWKQWRIAHLMLAITFLTSGVMMNLVQGSLYYLVRPWNKPLFRHLNYYVNYSLFCQIVFLAQYWGDVRVKVHIDKEDYDKYYGKEHGYLIMNHTYEIDWVVGWILADNVNLLGNCKTYGKKSIQYVPTMGWAWKFGESVFLERSWDKDKEIIGRQLRELVQYPDPMWLLLMAEGTRFTKDKYEASATFAKEKGLPILKHHLTPRTRGFTSSLPYLRGKVPAVYNVTLGLPTEGIAPTLRNVLLGKRIDASMYMERIPLDTIPTDEAESVKWLHELYEKKDRMLDSYFKTGDWFKNNNEKKVEGFLLPRRIAPLVNTLIWAVIVLFLVAKYLLHLVSTGNVIGVAIAVLVISSFLYLLNRLIGQTEVSKGSSYGASSPTTPTSNPH